MRYRADIARAAGFSLVEVLVALMVISVGLLGVAKMQALSLSNTTSARWRSLAAIQAASLASSMHTDRAYWITVTGSSTTTAAAASAGVASATDALFQAQIAAAAAVANSATNYCTNGAAGSVAPCTPIQLAAADLQAWAASLYALMPSSQAAITCDGNPLTCQIKISWYENLVAYNAKTTANSAAIQSSSYILYVQP